MATNHGIRSAEIKYPQGCKDINEELSTDDLIRRLKDIAMAFQQMSQEENNQNFVPLALYLANDYFLEHHSRDVRLLVACSIADVFRVYAPNAPYETSDMIRRIFLFFIQQLRGLQDPKDATFKRYFYLLENLAWVKSFNICIELEESQHIFCELFSLIFKIVNENHSDKVKNFMLDMLTPLISESDTVSTKLLQIILFQVIDPKKTTNKQAYWLASQILIKTCATMEPYLQTYFSKAITRGVNENGDASDDEGASNDNDADDPKGKNNKKKQANNVVSIPQICELIYELNQICPALVQSTIPMIEFKLKSNEEKERCEYTKLLARLFSDKNSELAVRYQEIWKSFLGRFRDINVTVRVRCVQYSMHFLVNHPELRMDITEQLRQRQHDADENVRYEVVMAIISAGKKGIENINECLLEFVKERTLDKKFKIRREALLGMAQLYKQYNFHLANNEEVVSDEAQGSLRMLSWIKNKCMHNYYQTQLEDKLLVERILHTCLIPFSLPLTQRMKALYVFYCSIDGNASRAFNELLKQQQGVRRQMKDVMDILCRVDKVEDRDLQLKAKVAIVAKNLTEPVKSEEYINKLCLNLETNMTAKQHMNLIVTSASFIQMTEDGKCIAPANSSVIEQSVREILKSLGFPVQTNSFYMIIKQLMERIAPIMIDHQGLLMLFNYVSDSLIGDGELDNQMGLRNSALRGLQLIHTLSNVFPALFHGREIFNAYLLPFLWQCGTQHQIAETVLQILTNIGATAFSDSMEALENTTVPWWAENEEFITRLVDKYILNAATTKQAKYAVQCLNAIILDDTTKVRVFGEIIDKIKSAELSLTSTPFFQVHLVALGMIAINGGYVYFPKMLRSIVQKFIVQGLLLKDVRTEHEIETLQNTEKEKSATTDVNVVYEGLSAEVKAKCEGIKLLVRWIYGLKLNSIMVPHETQEETHSYYQKAATNALQLLKTIIQNGGDLNGNGRGGTTLEKAYMRLTAANAMIKIASNDALSSINSNSEPVFQKCATTLDIMTAQQWHCLATTLLDEQEFVQEKFLAKLQKGLLSLNLGLEFLAFLSLGGLFENNNFKTKIRNYLNVNYVKRRDLVKSRVTPNLKSIVPDCVMPFVIHLIAHMPFFSQYDDVEQLEKVKDCLWFAMESLVLKNELYSFSFFKKTFENMKHCIDRITASNYRNPAVDPVVSSNATHTNYRIWAACDLAMGLVMSKTQNFLLKDFPVQPSLPGKYFSPSHDTENGTKSYLPPAMQFAPPKKCGLETEMLGKMSKNSHAKKPLRHKANTSTELIDEFIIEGDAANSTAQHPTRSRKQQIVMNSDNEAEANSLAEGEANSSTAEKSAAERSEYDFDDSNTGDGGAQQASEGRTTEQAPAEEAEARPKRGRPPSKATAAATAAAAAAATTASSSRARENDTSPPRKSLRIAKTIRSPVRLSPSPEPEPTTRSRGRGRGRGRK
ncbi:Sister chromatid cohesion protein PDS5 A [Tyrophagus putrescentiae]|nr:Sister chromatid cohesion protein PDS5 A [Tyrophagus putrescentiae]